MATVTSRSLPDDRNGRPPLVDGDRLSRDEFERRYHAMPEGTKAELIEGVVSMPSPVRQRDHGKQQSLLAWWLVTYMMNTPGVEPGDNSTVRLDLANEPQPDNLLFIDPARGGQVRLSADGYIEGSPELVGEISASTAGIDLGVKLTVYQRNGVKEYIVWRVLDQEIDWFILQNGRFERQVPDAQGIVRSQVFPGLWLDPAALVRGDLAAVLAVLNQGLASPEHTAFVARLNPPFPR